MPTVQVIDGNLLHNNDDPNHAAVGAPVGSFYHRVTGSHSELWVKATPGANGWVRLH